jgi:co-chaperonin GroES (HSP10)
MSHAIRPKQGMVLLEMFPPEATTAGGLHLHPDDQEVSQKARVVRFGIWRQDKRGALIPHPCLPGDVVYISQRAGRWLDAWVTGEGKRWKIVEETELLAILT